jgi:hypothetical protein
VGGIIYILNSDSGDFCYTFDLFCSINSDETEGIGTTGGILDSRGIIGVFVTEGIGFIASYS